MLSLNERTLLCFEDSGCPQLEHRRLAVTLKRAYHVGMLRFAGRLAWSPSQLASHSPQPSQLFQLPEQHHHFVAGMGLPKSYSVLALGSPLPHLHWDWVAPMFSWTGPANLSLEARRGFLPPGIETRLDRSSKREHRPRARLAQPPHLDAEGAVELEPRVCHAPINTTHAIRLSSLQDFTTSPHHHPIEHTHAHTTYAIRL